MSKFRNKLAEALYLDSLDGVYETVGDVSLGGHFTLIEITTVLELPDSEGNDVVVAPGLYLLTEDELGFVDATDENAALAFEMARENYDNLFGDEEK